MSKKIVLTGGGTAGHVTPNIALINLLKKNEYEIVYIGSHNGIEKELIEKENIKYYGISSGKLRRQLSLKNFTDGFRVLKGYKDAKRILKKEKPDIVFSKGGFVTVPVVYAASSLKIPCVIHESDLTMGLANKLCSRKADKICCNFEKTMGFLDKNKAVLTGQPIREELFEGDSERGRKFLQINNNKPVLLIMGGSLGAKAINDVIYSNIDFLLKKYNVVHICGKGKMNTEFLYKDGYKQFEYVDKELSDILKTVDIVISRAGANAISELLALHKPNILIPLSRAASRGDQILNANEFEKKGYSIKIEEEDLNIDKLLEELNKLENNKLYYIDNMKKVYKSRAVNLLIDIFNNILDE